MVPARTRSKMRAAWTPERRAAQAERMRKLVRKRNRSKSDNGEARTISRSMEALIYLRKAVGYIRDGYKEGAEITAADTYVFLALQTLEGKNK